MSPPTGAPPQERTTATAEGEYRWVYLWHWPIRAMHWVAAACIVALVVTGFYIGRPYFMTSEDAAATPFIMGWMRFIHFAAAAVLVATGIVRIYWLVAGNKYERFKALFPVRPRDWVNMFRTIKKYLMIHPERGPHYLGHNPIQQFSYTAVYLLVLVQVVTGFAMYGLSNPGGFFATMFGWVGPLFGGIQIVRFVHHVVTWAFIIFVPIHVYLALRADVMDREGGMSSIFSGGRFVRSEVDYEDD